MNKNKKRFLSAVLAGAMVFSAISPASAAIPRSEEGYYALENSQYGQRYMSDIKFTSFFDSIYDEETLEGRARYVLGKGLKNGDYLDKDLNDGAGGDFVYVGWDGTNDPNDAITGIRLLEFDYNYRQHYPDESYEEDGVTWYLEKDYLSLGANGSIFEGEYHVGGVELNSNAGGDYIYMYYTKDPSYGPPLQAIKYTEDDTIKLDQYHDPIVRFGDHEWYDVNDGAGGDYIYLYEMSGFQPVDIPKLRELVAQAEQCLAEAEGSAGISKLQEAYESGSATLAAWGDDKYYTEDTSMGAQVASDIDNLENALKAFTMEIAAGNVDGLDGNTDNNDSETTNTDSIVMQIKNKIMLNGKNINSDAVPIIVDNRAMVPIRVLPALLGVTADWDEATRTVTLNMGGEVYSMTIDQPIADFGTSVVVRDGHVYVPIRYVAEKLGANVEWISATQQVLIEMWNQI